MIQLRITGMTCGSCVRTLEGSLKRVEGVEHVSIDLRQETADVRGTPDPKALIDAVQDEGYGATLLQN